MKNKGIKRLLLTAMTTLTIGVQAFAIESGKVTANVLNVRMGPSINNTIVGKLFSGNTVNIVAETNGWYQISYNSETAFVSSEYISILDNTVSRGGFRSTDTAVSVGDNIVSYALNFIGVPYVYGGSSPNGFDCSGFTKYIFENFGYWLPRTSNSQYAYGKRVIKSELKAGDLVFFKPYSTASYISHVGIYLSDGDFIHAPVPGQTVKISSLATGWFSDKYYGGLRVAQ